MLDGTVLAFDFGTKRIGVAVGSTITQQARPLMTLSVPSAKIPWPAIDALIKEWNIIAMVVGIPLNMDGTPQTITSRCREFARECFQRFQCPVFGVDERLSTVEARQRVFEEQGYRGLQNAEVDSVAAVLMLEQWFGAQQQAEEIFHD